MRNRYVVAALAGGLLLAGCGSSAAGSPGVPTLSQAAAQGAQNQGAQSPAAQGSQSQGPQEPSTQLTGSARAAALQAAAQCIRQHGIPGYADPVLTGSGAVYSDSRSIQNASDPAVSAVH